MKTIYDLKREYDNIANDIRQKIDLYKKLTNQ